MNATFRRSAMAVAGVVLAIAGAAAFAKAVGLIGDAEIWMLWALAFPAIGASRLLLTRVFGAGRFKGLTLAGQRLGLPLDLRTGELAGRFRGVAVRVYPQLRRQVAIEVRDGVSGETQTRGGLGDPWERRTADKIVEHVRAMVSDAERVQRALIARLANGADASRATTIRRLAAIPTNERIAEVDDTLALALKDDSRHVRLAAASAKGPAALAALFGADDAPWLAQALTSDEGTCRDAARALAIVGTIEALAPLHAAEQTPEVEQAIEAIKSRTGAEGGRMSLAPAEGGEVSIARQAGDLSKVKDS